MKINKKSTEKFWDKADRLIVVAVGGAALGGSIALANPTPTPPTVEEIIPTESEPVEGEINDAPRTEDNPLLRPDLDSLIENKIAEDVWSQLKGDLPCIESTES
jgi:hypothetical protein